MATDTGVDDIVRFLQVTLYVLIAIFLLISSILGGALLALPSWGPQFAEWLTAPEAREKTDAIFVLGGETLERIETAIALYEAGAAPHIYITGYNPDEATRIDSTSEEARDLAIARGIKPEAVTLLVTKSTYEDAQAIRQVAEESHLSTVSVVTGWYHSRRAMCMIRTSLKDTGIRSAFVSAKGETTQYNWWDSHLGQVQGFGEIWKLSYYALFYRMPISDCWSGDWQFTPFILIPIIGLIMSALQVWWVRRGALRKNILDIPNHRSSHTTPTPRSGGMGIASTVLGIGLAVFLWNRSVTPLFPYLIAAGAVAVLGWRDDQSSLSARLRLSFQGVIALFFVISATSMMTLSLPIIGDISLAPFVAVLFSAFIVIGLTNAYNFMDGIDGIASMQAIVASTAWLVIFLLNGQISFAFIALALMAATLGFLYWNFPPAYIFMGDVGSTFLGFSLAALPLMADAADNTASSSRFLVTGLLFVGPFLFDSTLTIIRRILKGENILLSHRTHLYQRLTKIGYSHLQVTSLYTVLCILSALCGFIFYMCDSAISMIAIMGLLLVLSLLAFGITLLERKRRNSSL